MLEWHKIWSFHKHDTINHMGSIHFSYTWLCNWEHPFSTWSKGKSLGALHTGQALPWRASPTWCGTIRFLCAPTAQLVYQPSTTLNSTTSFEIHYQKPNLQVSHILDNQSSYQPVTRQEKPPWFPTNTIGKPRGAWPTFVSFLGAHAF
jgi:hypothetical protein